MLRGQHFMGIWFLVFILSQLCSISFSVSVGHWSCDDDALTAFISPRSYENLTEEQARTTFNGFTNSKLLTRAATTTQCFQEYYAHINPSQPTPIWLMGGTTASCYPQLIVCPKRMRLILQYNFVTQPSYCSSAEMVDNAFVTYPSGRRHPSEALVTCDSQSYLVGSATVSCQSNGEWSTSPKCERFKCSYKPGIANGKFSSTGVLEGDKAKVVCNEGFHLDAGMDRQYTCDHDGWPNVSSSCKRITCRSPNRSRNTNVLPQRAAFVYNEVVNFSCAVGYSLVGAATATCKRLGWTQIPHCEKIGCVANINNTSGYLVFSGLTSGSTGRLHCYAGHELRGDPTTICDEWGDWRSIKGHCEAMSCRPPQLNDFLRIENETGNRSYRLKEVVYFSCAEAYILRGKNWTVCTEHGRWTQVPYCIEISYPFVTVQPGTPHSGQQPDWKSVGGSRAILVAIAFCGATACVMGIALFLSSRGIMPKAIPRLLGRLETLPRQLAERFTNLTPSSPNPVTASTTSTLPVVTYSNSHCSSAMPNSRTFASDDGTSNPGRERESSHELQSQHVHSSIALLGVVHRPQAEDDVYATVDAPTEGNEGDSVQDSSPYEAIYSQVKKIGSAQNQQQVAPKYAEVKKKTQPEVNPVNTSQASVSNDLYSKVNKCRT
ncbi:CUB and sushi domain-containing protein 1-like isoform X1 [Sycon ciliatum]|uniref:CUB and sushi domain-containing protein 1-like isoform X1 n=1 Tax=Sycon ciliatum TaxID=27933 RepID=UPI0031F62CFF